MATEAREGTTSGPVPNEAAKESADKQQADNNKKDKRDTSRNDSERKQPEFTPITEREEAENLWKQAKDFVEHKKAYEAWKKREQKRDPWAEQVLQQKERQLKENLEHFKGGGIGSFLRSIFELPKIEGDTEEGDSFQKTVAGSKSILDQKAKKELFEGWVTSGSDLSPEEVIYAVEKGLKRQAGASDGEEEGPEKSHPPFASEDERRRVENLGRGQIQEEIEKVLASRFPEVSDEQRKRLLREGMIRALGEKVLQQDPALRDSGLEDPDLRSTMEGLTRLVARARQQGEMDQSAQLEAFKEESAVSRAYGVQDKMAQVYRDVYAYARLGPPPLNDAEATSLAKKAVEDYIEEVLGAAEQDDQNVDQNEQLALRSAINFNFAENEIFREHLTTKVHARFNLHVNSWAAKYISAELLGQQITNFNTFHWKSILETLGVKKALEILEEKDDYGTKGAYYRNPEFKGDLDRSNPLIEVIWKNEEEKFKKSAKNSFRDINEEWVQKKIESEVRKSVWLVNQKFKFVEAARSQPEDLKIDNLRDYDGQNDLIKLALYTLEQINKGITKPHTPKTTVLELIKEHADQFNKLREMSGSPDDPEAKKFIKVLTDINRAFSLAVRVHHATGISSYYDGPRWKEKIKDEKTGKEIDFIIPEGYVGAGDKAKANRLIELNPIVKWKFKDPADGEEKIVSINLRTAESDAKNNPELRRALDNLRSNSGKNFVEIWNRAYREFYREHYDDIDFDASANSGRSARILRRVVNFPVILSQTGEAFPGKAVFLRRFTHLHTPSLMQHLGYDSALDAIDPDNWGPNYALMKEGWAQARLANAEKLKIAIQREEPDILNSVKALRDFEDSLDKMKPHMKHIMTGTGEVGEAIEDWFRGLLEFRAMHSDQVGMLNLTREGLEFAVGKGEILGLIDYKKAENIKRDMFTPNWLKKLASYKPFHYNHFPGKLIWGTFSFLDSSIENAKRLAWGRGIFAFIWELLKQIVTPPKG